MLFSCDRHTPRKFQRYHGLLSGLPALRVDTKKNMASLFLEHRSHPVPSLTQSFCVCVVAVVFRLILSFFVLSPFVDWLVGWWAGTVLRSVPKARPERVLAHVGIDYMDTQRWRTSGVYSARHGPSIYSLQSIQGSNQKQSSPFEELESKGW